MNALMTTAGWSFAPGKQMTRAGWSFDAGVHRTITAGWSLVQEADAA